MSAWPDTLKVGPIREWPGEFTRTRVVAPFTRHGQWVDGKRVGAGPVPLTITLRDLDREIRELGAKDLELLVAVPADRFRLDGRPRAGATAEHPGIILSFTIPGVGPVSYPCDRFTTWEANLRAVALALEALRKVDRYGVTKRGEQYRGFLAIEATPTPAGFTTAQAAAEFLAEVVDDELLGGTIGPNYAKILLRRAQRKSHPDRGGDDAIFQRVSLAEAKLREAGLL